MTDKPRLKLSTIAGRPVTILRAWVLRHRLQRLRDERETLRGQEVYARRKLAYTLLTIRDREVRIGRIERELASISSPRELVRQAVRA